MSVYVDDYDASYGRMRMSHMIADSTDELLKMSTTIGLAEKWIQHAGTYREHFDVCRTKRLAAVRHGAIQVTAMELGRILRTRRLLGWTPRTVAETAGAVTR